MSCQLKAYALCSASLQTWGLSNSGSINYWSGSLCGTNNSHSLFTDEYVWVSSSVKHTDGFVVGKVEIWKTTYSGSFTGSCYKSTSLVITGGLFTKFGKWRISSSCGSSTSNCVDTSISAIWVL